MCGPPAEAEGLCGLGHEAREDGFLYLQLGMLGERDTSLSSEKQLQNKHCMCCIAHTYVICYNESHRWKSCQHPETFHFQPRFSSRHRGLGSASLLLALRAGSSVMFASIEGSGTQYSHSRPQLQAHQGNCGWCGKVVLVKLSGCAFQ